MRDRGTKQTAIRRARGAYVRCATWACIALALPLARSQAQEAPVVAAEPAPTVPEAEPMRRLHLAYGTGIGGGVAPYVSGRHGGGFGWGAHVRVGFRLSGRLAVGGMFWFDPLFGVRGQTAHDLKISTPLALQVWLGPSVSLLREDFTAVVGLLVGGGGTVGTGPPAYGFGGAGFVLVCEMDFFVANGRVGRVGPFGRIALGTLHDFALPDVFEGYLSFNVGVAVELD